MGRISQTLSRASEYAATQSTSLNLFECKRVGERESVLKSVCVSVCVWERECVSVCERV